MIESWGHEAVAIGFGSSSNRGRREALPSAACVGCCPDGPSFPSGTFGFGRFECRVAPSRGLILIIISLSAYS